MQNRLHMMTLQFTKFHLHLSWLLQLFKFNAYSHTACHFYTGTILAEKTQVHSNENSDQCQDIRIDILGSIHRSQVDRFRTNKISAESSVVLQDIAWTVLHNIITNTYSLPPNQHLQTERIYKYKWTKNTDCTTHDSDMQLTKVN